MTDNIKEIENTIEELEAQLEAEKLKLALEQAEDEAEAQALLELEAQKKAEEEEAARLAELALIEAEKEAERLRLEEEERLRLEAIEKEKLRRAKLQLRIDAIKHPYIIYNGNTSVTAHPQPQTYLQTILDMSPTVAGKILKSLEERDLQRSKDIILENRRKEYPLMDEVLHTLLDHGIDSPEMEALQQMRAVIKAKYPKDVQDA